MKKKQKLLFSCGIILLLSAYGLLAGFTFSKMAEIRSSKSKVLLQESQKEVNSRKSIALAQLALLLEADDEGYLIAGEKAEIAGYNDKAASYYKKIKTAEGLTIHGNTYLKNNQNKEAEEAFQKALNKEEGLKALTGLGSVYLKQVLAEKAKKSFDRALELVKDDENALSGSKLADLVLDQQILDEKIGSDSINQQLQKIVQTPTLSTRINLLFEYRFYAVVTGALSYLCHKK